MITFSLELMKDIATFCEKTLTSATSEKLKVDTSLKKSTDNQEYKTIKQTINKSIETTRSICHKRKEKKLSNLKRGKPIRQLHSVSQTENITKQHPYIQRTIPSYADTVKSNPVQFRVTNANTKPKEISNSLSERIQTFHNNSRRQRDTTTENPRTITQKSGRVRLLQRPTENRKATPHQILNEQLHHPTYTHAFQPNNFHQQIDIDNQPKNSKNLLTASTTSGGLEEILSALNRNTQVIIDFGKSLKQIIEQ